MITQTLPQNKTPRVFTKPAGWPTDDRSRMHSLDGQVFIDHPERKPHIYNAETQQWREIT